MVLQQVQLYISVGPLEHWVQGVVHGRVMSDPSLTALTHHEHWEVITLLIRVGHVIENCIKSFLIFIINDCLSRVTWQVNSIA